MNRTGDRGEAAAAKDLTGTVVRGTALAGIGYALSQILTLASYLVLARLVTPSEFGLFTAGLVMVGLARLYTESGMLAALVYRRDRLEEPPSWGGPNQGDRRIDFPILLASSSLLGRPCHAARERRCKVLRECKPQETFVKQFPYLVQRLGCWHTIGCEMCPGRARPKTVTPRSAEESALPLGHRPRTSG